MVHTITFEFIPGDEVFFMHDNQVTEGTVKHIQTNQGNDGVSVKYSVVYKDSTKDNYPITVIRSAYYIFKSKKELLESL
jgi:hypothetical protein